MHSTLAEAALDGLREQAHRLGQACWKRLADGIDGHQSDWSRLPGRECAGAVQGMADDIIQEFYEAHAPVWMEQAVTETADFLRSAHGLVAALLDGAAEKLAGLMDVPSRPRGLPALTLPKPDFLWRTTRAHGAVGGGWKLAVHDLLPTARRWAVLREAFAEDYGMLCQRNANVLYNTVADRLSLLVAALEKSLDEGLETSLRLTIDAMARAQRLHAESGDSASQQIQDLETWMAAFRSLLETS